MGSRSLIGFLRSRQRRAPLTPDEIRAGLGRLPGWFHCIDLGHGILTKTASLCGEVVDHPRPTWQLVRPCLPLNLRGLSVLDVGCNGGFYAFEAKRRGAGRVVGIEAAAHHVRQAEFVRDVLGLPVEIAQGSVYDLSAKRHGTFDVTLALGLIYHCKHPMLALERLQEVTEGILIVESEVLPRARWQAFQVRYGHDVPTSLHPVAWVENPRESVEAVQNWFVPSASALRSMALSSGFADATIVTETEGRAIVVARKTSPSSALLAQLDLLEGISACTPGAPLPFRVHARNVGTRAWPSSAMPGETTVNLGAHLLTIDGAELERDLARAPLPRDVAPGETVEVPLAVTAPMDHGKYLIEIDLVAEQVAWFEDLGTLPLRCRLEVHSGTPDA